MTDEEFHEWFLENIEIMASMGIYHPRSDRGKVVRSMVSFFNHRLNDMENRIKSLEEREK